MISEMTPRGIEKTDVSYGRSLACGIGVDTDFFLLLPLELFKNNIILLCNS